MSNLKVLREWTPISATKKMIKESRDKYVKIIYKSGIDVSK